QVAFHGAKSGDVIRIKPAGIQSPALRIRVNDEAPYTATLAEGAYEASLLDERGGVKNAVRFPIGSGGRVSVDLSKDNRAILRVRFPADERQWHVGVSR